MKKIKDIEKEIESQIQTVKNLASNPENEFHENKARKRIEFLRWVIKYLETNPSPEFVKSELQRCKDAVKLRADELKKLIEQKFKDPTFNGNLLKDFKADFNKDQGVPLLKKNIKTLEFILFD